MKKKIRFRLCTGYFPHAGGFVVIEQNSGRIVKALLCK